MAPWSRVKHSTTEPLCYLYLLVSVYNFYHFYGENNKGSFSNNLYLGSPKRVLLQTVSDEMQHYLQTVKTQMKCSIMLHFIRVYTVCIGKKGYDMFRKL